MKKQGLALIWIFVFFIVIVAVYFVTEFKVEGGWVKAGEKTIVLANKTWKFTFSDKLFQESVHSESVYVTNDSGEHIPVKLSVSDDLRTLVIDPPEGGYDLKARAFTLHVTKAVRSEMGRKLKSNKELEFVVIDKLPVVGSKEKLNEYYAAILKKQEQEQKQGLFFRMNDSIAVQEESTKSSADTSSGASGNYSETNIQVQGVDEADIVKTNGTHIFQIVDGKVNIIAVNSGARMDLQAVITFPQTFTPSQLFLHEDWLVVIGHEYEPMEKRISAEQTTDMKIAPIQGMTTAIVYNIVNPKGPTEERRVSLEGNPVSSRKIDDVIYLVTNQYPQFWLLRDYEDMEMRPRFSDSSASGEMEFIDYNKIQYFPESQEANYTMIAAFALEQPAEDAKITTYLGSGNQLYMSKNNLYLAVEDWSSTGDVKDRASTMTTNIYKFTIQQLEVEFHSSTGVAGRVLNQFSMDEYDDNFRVAVTDGIVWDDERPSSNNLFIFDENLKELSSLQGLARGERIYSARFMGERIYLVTFKETDPLFVIDAANPNEPKVMGELKIPGFSNYLHPIDENHLLGFGHDTKVVPRKDSGEPLIYTDGVKISLFDVTDMTNPIEKFTEVIGGRGTYSPLNYDHRALLYHQGKNLFAFPINVYQNILGSEYEQKFEFQGAYVYEVDLGAGFSLKEKISHLKGNSPYEEWGSQVQRILYIDETLYVLSNEKITSHSLETYTQIAELPL